MVMVPPRYYCVILNPVVRGADGAVELNVGGQVRLRHADLEIRLAQDPFPLYPGEELQQVRTCQLLLSTVGPHSEGTIRGPLDVGHMCLLAMMVPLTSIITDNTPLNSNS